MAFVSYSKIASESRRSRGRGARAARSMISVTQSYSERLQSTTLTFRISGEALKEARIHIGDRADIQHDPERDLWRIGAIQPANTNEGYAVSGTKKSNYGQIRITHYPGMQLLNEDPTQKAKGFSDDETIRLSFGEIIFSIKNIELISDNRKGGENDEVI